MAELLSIAEVAKHFGKEPRHVRYRIKTGEIPAERIGWNWVIPKETLPKRWPGRKK